MDQLPGICCDAATRIFGFSKRHIGYALKLEKNLTSLQNKRDELQSIYQDVENRTKRDEIDNAEMQRTSEVTNWLKKVEDLLQILKDIEAQGSHEIRQKCLSGFCPKNCVSSYKMGKKVTEKTLEVEELVTSGRRFLDKNVEVVQRLPPNLVEEIPCGEATGMEVMLNKVWNNLNDDNNVGIIGLYGMGGAGKTTLLKRVHNELAGKRELKFELVLWVVVSKDWNINKIMNDIRNKLGIQDDFWDRSSDDQRAARIHHVLKQKRFVLMLDDLWEKLELERVGVPHPMETNFQSKVVLTTRSEDVCFKMQANVRFKVECLLENEAFDLFCKKVGAETLNSHIEIKKLAREMADECAGLPLSLVTLGSAMAGVKNVETWRLAKKDLMNFPLTSSDLEKNVFSILKFSYDRLPDETHKNCFLYCALYPEDYAINVGELIDRWMGEGFLGKGKKYISKRSTYDMYGEGQFVIEKLKLSSLLEDATDCVNDIRMRPAVKMHDVVRDMALWLARDQDENRLKVIVEREALTMDFERLDDVERISAIDVEGSWQHIPACPNLLMLFVQKNLLICDFSNLQFMTRLKVLDFSFNKHIKYLPIEVGKLINLEYLNLSEMILYGELPIELRNLQRLRVFLMEDTDAEIPLEVFDGLKRLQVFRYWDYSITKEEEEILVEKMESLPELEELGVYLKTINGIQKLFNSKKLQGCLRKLDLGYVEEPLEMASLLGSWSTMKHLEIIYLYRLNVIMEVSSIIPRTCHLDMLRELVIFKCYSLTHLTWLRYAPLLESLHVDLCNSMEEVVKGDQEYVDNDKLFSNLKVLHLSYLPKLKSIHKRALHFPSLKSIRVDNCDELRKLPLNANSAKDTLVVITVSDEEWVNNLEWEDPAAKDLFHSKFKVY